MSYQTGTPYSSVWTYKTEGKGKVVPARSETKTSKRCQAMKTPWYIVREGKDELVWKPWASAHGPNETSSIRTQIWPIHWMLYRQRLASNYTKGLGSKDGSRGIDPQRQGSSTADMMSCLLDVISWLSRSSLSLCVVLLWVCPLPS